MNENLYDVISSKGEATKPQASVSEKKPFDKVTWAEQKQIEREQAFNLIDTTASDVVLDGNKFKQYLDVLSKFDKYSLGNTLLIMAQNPNATKLADFEHWKENKAIIKKGEKGICILEPGEEYKREDGTLAVSYNVKKLFDITQTTATQKAPPTVKLDDRIILKALLNNSPVPINISENLRDNVGALYKHDTKEILVRKGMDGSDIVRSIAQEMAHAYLATSLDRDANYNRSENSFNAYAVSYVICKRNGIDTNNYDFTDISELFSGLDTQTIREELSGIRTVANDISNNMADVLNSTTKQHNKNKSEQSR